jgi:serine/threonine protein kinase
VLVDACGFVQLCDFGLAKVLGADGRTFTAVGTDDYMAPEVLRSIRATDGPTSFGLAIDWWALGVLIFEGLVGFSPFSDAQSVGTTHRHILHAEETLRALFRNLPSTLPDSAGAKLSLAAQELISALCMGAESARLGSAHGYSGADVMAHPWFGSGYDWDGLVHCTVAPPLQPRLHSPTDDPNARSPPLGPSHARAELPKSPALSPTRASEGNFFDLDAHGAVGTPPDALLEPCWRELQTFYARGEVLHEMAHLL